MTTKYNFPKSAGLALQVVYLIINSDVFKKRCFFSSEYFLRELCTEEVTTAQYEKFDAQQYDGPCRLFVARLEFMQDSIVVGPDIVMKLLVVLSGGDSPEWECVHAEAETADKTICFGDTQLIELLLNARPSSPKETISISLPQWQPAIAT